MRKYGLALPAAVGGSDSDILQAVDAFAVTGVDATPVYPHIIPVWASLDKGGFRRLGLPSVELMDALVERGITPMVYLSSASTRLSYINQEANPYPRLSVRTELPIIIRIDHEMNGTWAPWSVSPEVYKKRWVRIVRHMRKFAPNAKFHWCPQGMRTFNQAREEFPLWYPGDEWVDIVGFDCYDLGARRPLAKAWENPMDALREFTGKRILVGEFGSLKIPGEPRDMWLRTAPFVENVWGAIYFNIDMSKMNHPTDHRNWAMTPNMETVYRSLIYSV